MTFHTEQDMIGSAARLQPGSLLYVTETETLYVRISSGFREILVRFFVSSLMSSKQKPIDCISYLAQMVHINL